MKVLDCSLTNFGSYKSLDFNFRDLGLALVFGKTGSGKSTLPDMVAWTLYGTTAKDGSVDDVRSWLTPYEPTTGRVTVHLGGAENNFIEVTRIRGKATENDLYWRDYTSGKVERGKDLNDTQKLLNARLGVNSELYFTASYFHEFSNTGLFFTAKAKDRRALFEGIAKMDLAVLLGEKAVEARKVAKKELGPLISKLSSLSGQRDAHSAALVDARERGQSYDIHLQERIKEYEVKRLAFEKTKAQKIEAARLKAEHWDATTDKRLDQLFQEADKLKAKIVEVKALPKSTPLCKECGGISKKHQDKIDEINRQISANDRLRDKMAALDKEILTLSSAENPFAPGVVQAKAEENTYDLQIAEEKKKPNPFKDQVNKIVLQLADITDLISKQESQIDSLETYISNISRLYDLSLDLRGALLEQAVQDAQDSTNRYLDKFFDSEIRVSFKLEGSDDLDITIHKSGYECSYKQLSRGQRALLRMAFSVSVMKASANKAGAHFDNLFFDEVLDGMDADLKIKAYALLEELSTEHGSIMVIDHDLGFQNMFEKKFHVVLESDISRIEAVGE